MEQQIERSKVAVRWLVATVLFVAVAYLKRAGLLAVSWPSILGLAGAIAALNVAYTVVLRSGAPWWLKYVTTGTDLLILSLLVWFTGGSASVFYYAYFIVLVSNSIRYGMPMALYVATVYNIAYVVVLLFTPPSGDLTVEAVKILTFWGIALYAGYLAMRFQRQNRILQSYEETIAQLRANAGARPDADR
ncbi:MAG TPA: hypothetical protein VGK88_00110 [bacterium]|jgi:hypothetical protein